jgi:competence ComEA-like helix-hairpin-helix protein
VIHFTPAERRAIVLLLVLLAVGTAHDLWRARSRPAAPHGPRAAALEGAEEPEAGAPASGWEARRDELALRQPGVPAPAPGDSSPPRPRLNLNRATAEDLDGLPGVGPVLAQRILDFRRRHGRFQRVEDLRAVRGIGPRLLERLRPLVAAGASRSPP